MKRRRRGRTGRRYRAHHPHSTPLHHRIDKDNVDPLEIAIAVEPRFDERAFPPKSGTCST